jgi:hypothetical protein
LPISFFLLFGLSRARTYKNIRESLAVGSMVRGRRAPAQVEGNSGMTTIAILQCESAAIRKWQMVVAEAALPFEARWTLAALKRADGNIHRRLTDQRNLFDRALLTGSAEDIEIHGAALCRGYSMAIQALEKAAEPDDAYLLGQDARSGFRVAIGQQKAAAQRVRELHGDKVVWITPDEVAAITANIEKF